MPEIRLTRGYAAIVDDGDFDALSKLKWTASVSGKRPQVYAYRQEMRGGKLVMIYLHRFIANAQKGEMVDHIDGNSLNNSRSNLRICSQFENSRNKKKYEGKSKYKGVSWHKEKQKWLAQIRAGELRKFLGYFTDEEDAALAYDIASKQLHGAFGRQNFAA